MDFSKKMKFLFLVNLKDLIERYDARKDEEPNWSEKSDIRASKCYFLTFLTHFENFVKSAWLLIPIFLEPLQFWIWNFQDFVIHLLEQMCKVSAKSERVTWGSLVELAWCICKLKKICTEKELFYLHYKPGD